MRIVCTSAPQWLSCGAGSSQLQEFRVNIRSVYTSAIAAMGIACSSSAFAGTVFVHAAYVPTAVVYVPPRTLYYVPPQPHYIVPVVPYAPYVPAPVVVTTALPPRPLPYATVAVPIVAAPPYPAVAVKTVTYAQPVMPVPVVITR
jgi:hypothetical protein